MSLVPPYFNIKNFDNGSGLMTLEYDNIRGNAGAYITCGEFISTQVAYKIHIPILNLQLIT